MSDKVLVRFFKGFFTLFLVIAILCSSSIRIKAVTFCKQMTAFAVGVFYGTGQAPEEEQPDRVINVDERYITVRE